MVDFFGDCAILFLVMRDKIEMEEVFTENLEQLIDENNQALVAEFDRIHQQLDQSASDVAANVISDLLENRM